MDFISFNTTPYNPQPNHRKVHVKHLVIPPISVNVDAQTFPLVLPPLTGNLAVAAQDVIPPFPIQETKDTAYEERKTPKDTNPFWEHLAAVVSRLPSCQGRFNDIYDHCQRMNLQGSPLPCVIDSWIAQDYQTLYATHNDPRFAPNFEPTAYFEEDILSEDYIAAYHKWSLLSWCQRYYITYCIGKSIDQDRTEDEPNLDAWSLQILLCNILSGSDYLRQQTLRLLSGLNLNLWCDRYIFAGGMLRHQLLQEASTDLFHHHVDTVMNIILSMMGPGEGKITDWVAFFEHFDNLSATLDMINKNLLIHDSIEIILPTWKKLTDQDFKDNKCREGIFESVVEVLGDKVKLKYHGWPYPIQVDIKFIQDERILRNIKPLSANFLDS